MINNYLNTSGKASIIIKAASDCVIAGKDYIEGQLVTTIKDASFDIQYNSLNKKVNGRTTLLGSSDYEVSSLIISSNNINDTLADLLFTEKSIDANYNVPQIDYRESDGDGNIILRYTPLEENIMVYSMNKDLYTGWTLAANGIINGLAANTEYFISYYTEQILAVLYSLGKNSVPYLTIEIKNEFNINDVGKNMIIKIPRASLNIEPLLKFNAKEVTNIELTFDIIKAEMYLGFY